MVVTPAKVDVKRAIVDQEIWTNENGLQPVRNLLFTMLKAPGRALLTTFTSVQVLLDDWLLTL